MPPPSRSIPLPVCDWKRQSNDLVLGTPSAVKQPSLLWKQKFHPPLMTLCLEWEAIWQYFSNFTWWPSATKNSNRLRKCSSVRIHHTSIIDFTHHYKLVDCPTLASPMTQLHKDNGYSITTARLTGAVIWDALYFNLSHMILQELLYSGTSGSFQFGWAFTINWWCFYSLDWPFFQ